MARVYQSLEVSRARPEMVRFKAVLPRRDVRKALCLGSQVDLRRWQGSLDHVGLMPMVLGASSLQVSREVAYSKPPFACPRPLSTHAHARYPHQKKLDSSNNAIRRVSPNGIIRTVAGNVSSSPGNSGDGGLGAHDAALSWLL